MTAAACGSRAGGDWRQCVLAPAAPHSQTKQFPVLPLLFLFHVCVFFSAFLFILLWTSLAVQWLRRCASTAGDKGSISGQGTKSTCASRPKEKDSQVYILESDGAKRFINSSFTSLLIAFLHLKCFLFNFPKFSYDVS